jgi:hypothetical protein
MKPKDHLTVASPDEAKVNLRKKGDSRAHGNESQLPHERDQSLHATGGNVHPRWSKPTTTSRGLVDTDARASDGRPLGSRRTT